MKLTKYLPQFASLLLLMGLTVPAFSLAAGYLDTAGTDNPESPSSAAGTTAHSTAAPGQSGTVGSQTTSPVPVTPGTNGISLPTYADNLSKVMGISSVDGLTADRTKVDLADRIADYQRLLAGIDQYAPDSALMTVADYDPALWQITAGEIYNLPYASGSEVIIRYSKAESNKDASYTTVATPVTVGRQSVKAYMGYLLISTEDGNKITLCDSFGTVLAENIAGYDPYYARDFSNNPVFVKEERLFTAYLGR